MRRKQQDNIQFGNLQTKAHRMVFFTLAFMMICSKVTGSWIIHTIDSIDSCGWRWWQGKWKVLNDYLCLLVNDVFRLGKIWRKTKFIFICTKKSCIPQSGFIRIRSTMMFMGNVTNFSPEQGVILTNIENEA